MPIPDFQTAMRPVLAVHEDGGEYPQKEIVAAIAKSFDLTPEEQVQRTPGGSQTVLRSNVGWAVTDLAKAGLLTRTRRGYTQLTERGRDFLAVHPDRIDRNMLRAFPEFQAYLNRKKPVAEAAADEEVPKEAIPRLVTSWHEAVADDLLQRLRAAPPSFLERAVLTLLVKMGYGGPVGDAVHFGGPGDGGVDGLVRKDPLGLDVVYVQAKRYAADRPVSSGEVQAFVGALHGRQTDRGLFITTSHFSRAAQEYIGKVQLRIILIDGPELARLMVEHKLRRPGRRDDRPQGDRRRLLRRITAGRW